MNPPVGGTDAPDVVHTVLVVSKSHLDVGFTGLAGEVRERWLRSHLPTAVATARELRDAGDGPTLRWTTGSWILNEALEEPDRELRLLVEHAIEDGDLAWHAMPFTTHTELADRSLLAHGLSISSRLDQWFERRTRAAKLTDVPGHTRSLVSLLADSGVDLLHIGINPAAAAPDVPPLFRWNDPAGGEPPPEVTVVHQPGGYGSLQRLGDTGVVVDVWMTGDNDGPPSAEDVRKRWTQLVAQFPQARVVAATFDDVADVLRPVANGLPVVTSEIGDTWIHGVASDPAKTAAFRETCRRRRGWIDGGRVAEDDPALWRASTELLLVAEHTWGLDQKAAWPDTEHWSEVELASVRPRPSTRRFEWSWSEQRTYLDRFREVLERAGRHDLAEDARAGMALCGSAPVDVEGLDALGRPADGGPIPVRLGPLELSIDPHDGALVGVVLSDAPGGPRELVGGGRSLGRLGHRTFDAADYERWFSTYNGATEAEDLDWARWDNTKPGLEHTAARSAWCAPDLVGVWAGRRPASTAAVAAVDPSAGPDAGEIGAEVLLLELSFPEEVRSFSAAPHWVVVGYELVDGRPDELSCWLQWVAKPAARWPESTWWSFAPTVSDPAGWTMSKLGEVISPLDVVARGARNLHAVESLQHPDGLRLSLPDAPLVAPGAPALLRFDDRLPDLAGGWHVCLYDNVWGTNFPMWCPGDARFRVTLAW